MTEAMPSIIIRPHHHVALGVYSRITRQFENQSLDPSRLVSSPIATPTMLPNSYFASSTLLVLTNSPARQPAQCPQLDEHLLVIEDE